MSDIGGGLARLFAGNDGVGVNESERIDDDLAFNGLNGVYDHRH